MVERITHDTLFITQLKYDSIYEKESQTERFHPSSFTYDTLVKSYIKVDTIYKEKVKSEYRYRLKHDTTYVSKTDTIPKVVTVTQDKKVIPKWCKYLSALGILFLLIILYRTWSFINCHFGHFNL